MRGGDCDCRPILHKYANEDVSLGSWFIGLEVEHIDEHNMCCGTPPGTAFERYMKLDNTRKKKESIIFRTKKEVGH